MIKLKLIVAWALALVFFGTILSITCYAAYRTFLYSLNSGIQPLFIAAVIFGCLYGLRRLVEWAVKTISEG